MKTLLSPIFYMGNKSKLVKKGLTDLFPSNIDTFYDLFCGSGTVAINTKANKLILNDIDNNTIELIKFFKYNSPNYVLDKICGYIDLYQLPTFSTDTRTFKGDREIYKTKYNKLREDYNISRSIELLYVLNIFSNSHMLRYNKFGEFNMPFGNGYFTDKCKQFISDNVYKDVTELHNKHYADFLNVDFNTDDFVYLDPPYYNTTATYTENGGWGIEQEQELHTFCEQLNLKGVKFALSNTFSNKGVENIQLIDWVTKNGYNVHFFDNFTYSSCGKGNAKTVEVLITNY